MTAAPIGSAEAHDRITQLVHALPRTSRYISLLDVPPTEFHIWATVLNVDTFTAQRLYNGRVRANLYALRGDCRFLVDTTADRLTGHTLPAGVDDKTNGEWVALPLTELPKLEVAALAETRVA